MKKWTFLRICPRTLPATRRRPAPMQRWYSEKGGSKTFPSVFDRLRDAREKDEKEGLFKMDVEKKRVLTAAGELPISPVMDPDWVKSMERFKEPKTPGSAKPVGRFRKLLAKNIYAQALATPVRFCNLSQTRLPKYFLQGFVAAMNPNTNEAWWTPADLIQSLPSDQKVTPGTGGRGVIKTGSQAEKAYILAHSDAVGRHQEPRKREDFSERLYANGRRLWRIARMPGGKSPIWRARMQDAVLDLMRYRAVQDLLDLAQRNEAMPWKNILTPLASFDDIRAIERKGCVLWRPASEAELEGKARALGGEEGQGSNTSEEKRVETADAASGAQEAAQAGAMETTRGDVNEGVDPVGGASSTSPEDQSAAEMHQPVPGKYATFDLADVQFGSKIAVHNLELLLGREHLQRLMEASPTFRQNPVLMLAQDISMEVQLRLWKLQGYLASEELDASPRRQKVVKDDVQEQEEETNRV